MENDFKFSVHLPWWSQRPCEKFGFTKSSAVQQRRQGGRPCAESTRVRATTWPSPSHVSRCSSGTTREARRLWRSPASWPCDASSCCCCYVDSVVSDSMRPHRRQPTRLPRPWDSPSKNTGVGCHFLLQCMKVKSESEGTQWCLTFSDPMDCSLPGFSIHGIFQARVLQWGAFAFSRLQQHGRPKADPSNEAQSTLTAKRDNKNVCFKLRKIGLRFPLSKHYLLYALYFPRSSPLTDAKITIYRWTISFLFYFY